MKKMNVLALAVFIASVGFAQVNQCDELKKENEFLKKELKLNQPIKFAVQDDIEVKLVSAKGNIKTQVIKLEYLITNKIKIRTIRFNSNTDQFVSIEGELIPVKSRYNIDKIELTTDVPIKTTIEIGTILPENTTIKLATLKYELGDNYPFIEGRIEFKDVPIDWK